MKVKIIKVTNEKQDNIDYGLLDAMLDAFICLSHKNSEFSNDAINDIIEKIINKPQFNKNSEVNKENEQDSKTPEPKIVQNPDSKILLDNTINNIINYIDYFSIINIDIYSLGMHIDRCREKFPKEDVIATVNRIMYYNKDKSLFFIYKCVKDIELLTNKNFVDSYKDFKNIMTKIKIQRMKLLFDIFLFIYDFYINFAKDGITLSFDNYVNRYVNDMRYLKNEIIDTEEIIRESYSKIMYNSIEDFTRDLLNALKSRLLKIESDFIYGKSE